MTYPLDRIKKEILQLGLEHKHLNSYNLKYNVPSCRHAVF